MPTKPGPGWCSVLTWGYITPIVRKAYERGAKLADIWETPALSATHAGPAFERRWKAEVAQHGAGAQVWRVAARMYLLQVLLGALPYLIRSLLNLITPEIIRQVCMKCRGPRTASRLVADRRVCVCVCVCLRLQIILYLEAGEDPSIELPAYHPYLYASAMFIVPILAGFGMQHGFRLTYKVAGHMRSGLVTAIYKKSLRLSSSAARAKGTTVGEITNLVSTDARKIIRGSRMWALTLCAPASIIAGMIFLVRLLGASAFAGFLCYLALFPIGGFFAKKQMGFQKLQLKAMDGRVKTTNEVLQGVRSIKLFGWEPSFITKLNQLRDKELEPLKGFVIANAGGVLAFTFSPVLASAVTFMVYSATGHELHASVVFPAIAFLMLIRVPLQILPVGISILVELQVSLRRIQDFLHLPEKKRLAPRKADGKHGVHIRHATFSWAREDPSEASSAPHPPAAQQQLQQQQQPQKSGAMERQVVLNGAPELSSAEAAFSTPNVANFALRDITLDAPAGALVVVVGRVAAGKSSLCQAMLSEMECHAGSVDVYGSVAYVPQQAFILNDTVKANILFGKRMDPQLFQATIEACALQSDLEILENGVETLVGDRGITLSGG